MKTITKYIDNNKYHTTLINFIYQFKCDKKEIMALTILSRLLNKSNSFYKDEASFQKEKLNRYIMAYNVLNQGINDVYFLNFSILIPNRNILEEDMLEKQVLFLLDNIFKNNLNDIDLFNKEKKLYIETLLNNYKNITFIAEKNLLDILDDECIFNKLKYRDLDNINDLEIDDVSNFYNKYIKNIKPKIFINGDIDIKRVDNIIYEYTKDFSLKEYKIITEYDNYYKDYELIEKCDISKFYQSILYMVYNVKDYKKDDYYKLYMIHLLLNSSSSGLLMNSLRKQSNLVYHTGSSVMLKNGLLFIKAITDKENINYAKKIINTIIEELNNIEKFEKNIKYIIRRLELSKERELDNFYISTSNFINKYYNTDLTTSEEIEILKNITFDELREFVNRLNLKIVYSLEGDVSARRG